MASLVNTERKEIRRKGGQLHVYFGLHNSSNPNAHKTYIKSYNKIASKSYGELISNIFGSPYIIFILLGMQINILK